MENKYTNPSKNSNKNTTKDYKNKLMETCECPNCGGVYKVEKVDKRKICPCKACLERRDEHYCEHMRGYDSDNDEPDYYGSKETNMNKPKLIDPIMLHIDKMQDSIRNNYKVSLDGVVYTFGSSVYEKNGNKSKNKINKKINNKIKNNKSRSRKNKSSSIELNENGGQNITLNFTDEEKLKLIKDYEEMCAANELCHQLDPDVNSGYQKHITVKYVNDQSLKTIKENFKEEIINKIQNEELPLDYYKGIKDIRYIKDLNKRIAESITHLSFDHASCIMKKVPYLPNCKVLELNSCDVEEIGQLPVCNKFKCFSSKIKIFPNLSNCECIDVSCCPNAIFSDQILPRCIELYCCNSRYTKLPDLPECIVLVCNNNSLGSLPLIPKCIFLNCKLNRITEVRRKIGFYKHLVSDYSCDCCECKERLNTIIVQKKALFLLQERLDILDKTKIENNGKINMDEYNALKSKIDNYPLLHANNNHKICKFSRHNMSLSNNLIYKDFLKYNTNLEIVQSKKSYGGYFLISTSILISAYVFNYCPF